MEPFNTQLENKSIFNFLLKSLGLNTFYICEKEGIKFKLPCQIIKEACVETFEQCVNAQNNGANRIELCADLCKGGTTPSYGMIKMVKEKLKIPVFVMIRPRGGNFVYSEEEIKIMLCDIEMCISLDVDGLVFGILDNQSQIDFDKNKRIMDFIQHYIAEKNKKIPMDKIKKFEVTFHMAFDEIPSQYHFNTIDLLIDLGFTRILTKGCQSKALDGIENIKKYLQYSNERIIILPGGGLTKENYLNFVELSECREVHGTKIV